MSKTDNKGLWETIKVSFYDSIQAAYDTLIPESSTAVISAFPEKYIFASIFIYQGE